MIIDKSNAKQKIGYGLKEGKIVHISTVRRGLECECVCPSCEGKLIAKQGDSNVHHFAHHDADGDRCSESVLHKLCKKILEDNKKLWVPETKVEQSADDVLGENHTLSYIFKERQFHFDRVFLEQSEGDFRPDITAEYIKEKVFIEIKVTHAVSDDKLIKVQELDVPMIEIDMSGYSAMDDIDKLTDAVLNQAPRTWVYHPKIQEIEINLQAAKVSYYKARCLKIPTIIIFSCLDISLFSDTHTRIRVSLITQY